ncbi:MAG: OB-fold domain-containing protein [Sphingobium sp.]
MAPVTERPLPLPDPLSRPFWDAAREHRLCVQACGRCDHLAYPPEAACRKCGSSDLHFRDVSGRATLHSWTVLHDPPSPGFRDRLPVILAVVELVEQKGLLLSTNLIDTVPGALRVDLPLEAWFEDVGNGCTLIQFRVRGA